MTVKEFFVVGIDDEEFQRRVRGSRGRPTAYLIRWVSK